MVQTRTTELSSASTAHSASTVAAAPTTPSPSTVVAGTSIESVSGGNNMLLVRGKSAAGVADFSCPQDEIPDDGA